MSNLRSAYMTQLVVRVPGRLFIKVTPGKKRKGKKTDFKPVSCNTECNSRNGSEVAW